MRLVQTLALDLTGTRTAVRKPSGLAAALVYRATGLLGVEVEQEVLSMVDLAEKVYDSLVEVGIDDVVRLSVDADILYEDLQGRESDLEGAFEKALERGLEGAGRIQIVLERRTERLHLVVRIDVHREHLPGAFPVWVRIWALPLDFLRRKRERRERQVRRIAELLGDEPARAEFEAAVERALEEVSGPLERALRKRLPVKVVQTARTWRHRRADEDYFFCLRPDTNEAVEAAIRAAEETLPEPRLAGGTPIPEFILAGEAAIRKMEARLAASGESSSDGGSPPLTWEAFSRRKVYNPATGKIARIRSLPPADQARYQMLFNAQVLDPDRRVRVYEPPGPLDRLAASTRRGVTSAVEKASARLADDAPRTHAFLADGTYRKAVLKELAPLLGRELYDRADALAHAIVGEIVETGRIPLAWWSGRKMTIDERDQARLDEARDQMLDLLELAVGTLVPIGAWAAGGPAAGLAGLAGIKVFQKALNWYSKRFGDGREWTIRPSRMIAREAEVEARRAPERAARRERLEGIRRRNQPTDPDRSRVEAELAETFREYGKMLEEKKVEFSAKDLDLGTYKEPDLLAAIEEEARARRESPSEGGPPA